MSQRANMKSQNRTFLENHGNRAPKGQRLVTKYKGHINSICNQVGLLLHQTSDVFIKLYSPKERNYFHSSHALTKEQRAHRLMTGSVKHFYSCLDSLFHFKDETVEIGGIREQGKNIRKFPAPKHQLFAAFFSSKGRQLLS